MGSHTSLRGRGTEQLTVSSSSVALASIPTGAKRALLVPRDAGVYVSNTGDAATTSMWLLSADSVLDLSDANYELSAFRFIRQASDDSTLHIMYFS